MVKKKASSIAIGSKRALVDYGDGPITTSRQCELLGLSRSSLYYQPCTKSEQYLTLMSAIDELYTKHPEYGSRRMKVVLRSEGHLVGRGLIRTIMQRMGIAAIYSKPNLSKPHPSHKVYPYLLRGVACTRVNQVWSTDITYIRMSNGFLYLTAVIDWYSRYVLAWKLSNSLDGLFCREVLKEAFEHGKPEIFNTDQGAQYTHKDFLSLLLDRGIKPSMDGRGRALDNVFVERLWRSVKYEDIYIREYQNASELHSGLNKYFTHYNTTRPHASLNYEFPAQVFNRG